MMKMYFFRTFLFFLLLNWSAIIASAQMTPQQAISKMTCGINVGRSLELPTEGDGTRFIQEYYFTDFKAAGFNCVRIPIRWDLHTGKTSPYTIDATWLNRVEQVVNWSLKHGLITIINSHHDDWILNNNGYTSTDLARFKAIWAQVSARFKDKTDSLMFEIGNEPNIAIEKVDQINANVIPIIRSTNPTRIVIFGSSGTQLSTLKQAVIPTDKYLIASFHTYEPWDFAGNGNGTWGNTSQINVVKAMIADAAAWSSSHKIPLFMGEFGTVGKCEVNSRMKWFYTHLEEARRLKIGLAVWQDFGDFSVYFNTTNAASKWNTAIKDIIVYTNPLSADGLNLEVKNASNAQLTWKNRASDYKSIKIDRKEGSASYNNIATIEGNATTYLDVTSITGKTYTYRVVSELSTGEITQSYPVTKTIVVPTSSNLAVDQNLTRYNAYISGNKLFIKAENRKNYAKVFYKLFNIEGQLIESGSFQSDLHLVNASKMPNGKYLLNIFDANGSSVKIKMLKL
jgi:aryl-phospho-beta-D-glucosidase BglC (GH1 family)